MAGPDVAKPRKPKKPKQPHMVRVGIPFTGGGGVLTNVTALKKLTGTKYIVKGAKGAAKAVTAASPGGMMKKAGGWLKRQGFVPTTR